jgi:excinuclease ABC subunit B
MAYNEEQGITPQTIYKTAEEIMRTTTVADVRKNAPMVAETKVAYEPGMKKEDIIERLKKEMRAAAANLEFERAAVLRDEIQKLSEMENN